MHLEHKTHNLCELHLHYSTHLTPISVSENLINTLTVRHRRKWGSGHLVRPEHSVQVQVPLSPELPFWSTMRKTSCCSSWRPSRLGRYWGCSRRLQKLFQKQLCHMIECH